MQIVAFMRACKIQGADLTVDYFSLTECSLENVLGLSNGDTVCGKTHFTALCCNDSQFTATAPWGRQRGISENLGVQILFLSSG